MLMSPKRPNSCPRLIATLTILLIVDLRGNDRHQHGLSAHFSGFNSTTRTHVQSILDDYCLSHIRLVSLVGKAPVYGAGGSGSIPGQTNTQGLKIIEEKVLPFSNIYKW